ncbi:hypothetical protein DFP72DRAFT_1175470 [Ephemerocybe angulata]|uniref:Uncharacterized protein n=1 Tax=Ephemerocybe angulata TaxID=980116 RepID=A0A8H6HIF1_9AGAR|nr:hypothetical protein DFP72DRAFT_1175470 [Tulosesus angulatus]
MPSSRNAVGRVQRVNGALFYSPNSLVNACLDIPTLDRHTDPFKPGTTSSRAKYTDLLKPRPWSTLFGWLSFLPTTPWYNSNPGTSRLVGVLARTPPITHLTNGDEDAHGYRLDSPNGWERLEREVHDAVTALIRFYGLPCDLPSLPHTLGYTAMYREKDHLVSRVDCSREWFLVWLGALSYAVASVMNPPLVTHSNPPQLKGYPAWRTILKQKAKLADGWIDDLLTSPVCDFRTENRRVGCIVNLLDPAVGQPPIEWLINCGVPVWYRWGTAEEKLAVRDDRIAALRPPSGIELEQFVSLGITGSEIERSISRERSVDPVPEWVEFFRRREQQKSTLGKDRHYLKARRQFSNGHLQSSFAPVFEWWIGRESKYERIPVPIDARVEVLSSYAEHQRRYDPFFNEWDCCLQLGAFDTSESKLGEPYDLSKAPPDTPLHPRDGGTHRQEVSYIANDRPSDLFLLEQEITAAPQRLTKEDTLFENVEDTFSLYYGFTLPPPSQPPSMGPAATSLTITPQDRHIFLRAVGLAKEVPDTHSYFNTPHYEAAQMFFKCLASRQDPSPYSWDLKDESVQPVRLTQRFRHFDVVERVLHSDDNPRRNPGPHRIQTYYVFTGPQHPTVPWKFVLLTAAAALLACRLPSHYTESDLAYVFAQRGVPFRTFFQPSSICAVPRTQLQTPVLLSLPIRRLDYLFTKEDYDAYIRMRTSLLSQPHMQASLKRGGIIWRLAIGTLGLSNILRATTGWVAVDELIISGVCYSDDVLTTTELDLICGAYECISENGKQRALKSWWPLARYYEKEECGENYGHWSHRREHWYEQRLSAIESGQSQNSQPLTYTEWKSLQHGPSAIRSFHAQIERASTQLFKLDINPQNHSIHT